MYTKAVVWATSATLLPMWDVGGSGMVPVPNMVADFRDKHHRRTWRAKARVERKPTYFVNLPNYLIFGFCQAYVYHGQHTFTRSRDRRPTIWRCKRCYWTCSTPLPPLGRPGSWTRESSWSLRTDVMVPDTDKFSYKHSSSQRTVA
jgi:hypothetical protein